MVFRDGDDSIRGCVNGGAIVRSHVHAGVKCAFTAERIQALAEAIGNVAHHRPNRWRVGGVRKAHRGEQMEPAAGDGNYCGVALQEGVLLDGAVKSILGIYGAVGLVESCRMVTEHAVRHSYFRRQGLERIEALVGVANGALKLLILLLERFLVVAESVVVPDFPKHSRIRAYRRRHGNTPNKGEYRDSVQHISRHDDLPELPRSRRDIERIALAPHAYRVLSDQQISVCGQTTLAPAGTNLNQNLNRGPRFATLHILNSVGWDVNPVFGTTRVRLCKPVPCPIGQVGAQRVPERARL